MGKIDQTSNRVMGYRKYVDEYVKFNKLNVVDQLT